AGPGVSTSSSCWRASGGGGSDGALSRTTAVGVGVRPEWVGSGAAWVRVVVACVGGATVVPVGLRAAPGIGGGMVEPARGGSVMPVGGPLLPARLGGSGGRRRPHAWHTASSSAFSALQNGQNRMSTCFDTRSGPQDS